MADPTNKDTDFARNRLRAIVQRGNTGPWVPAQQHQELHGNSTAADPHVQRCSTTTSQPTPVPGSSNGHASKAGHLWQPEVAAAVRAALAGALQCQQGQQYAAQSSLTADILRLAHACGDADTVLNSRAEQTLLGSVRPVQGTRSALLFLEHLSSAGIPVAVRVLAAITKVCISQQPDSV